MSSWLDRLRGRARPYVARRIDAIAEGDAWVELEGEVEGLELLHDPLEGRAAVVLNYWARRPGLAPRYFGVQDSGGTIEGYQATAFVLRDDSGTALIEVEPGGDLGELHRRLIDEFGLGLRAGVDLVEPGDRIRVRGRVRSRSDDGSPHRREPWTVVVTLDEVEPVDVGAV